MIIEQLHAYLTCRVYKYCSDIFVVLGFYLFCEVEYDRVSCQFVSKVCEELKQI